MFVLVIIGAVLGALCLLFSFVVGGAPQQAAMAATACAFAIIPYVLYRVVQLAASERRDKQLIELLRDRLPEQHGK